MNIEKVSFLTIFSLFFCWNQGSGRNLGHLCTNCANLCKFVFFLHFLHFFEKNKKFNAGCRLDWFLDPQKSCFFDKNFCRIYTFYKMFSNSRPIFFQKCYFSYRNLTSVSRAKICANFEKISATFYTTYFLFYFFVKKFIKKCIFLTGICDFKILKFLKILKIFVKIFSEILQNFPKFTKFSIQFF